LAAKNFDLEIDISTQTNQVNLVIESMGEPHKEAAFIKGRLLEPNRHPINSLPSANNTIFIPAFIPRKTLHFNHKPSRESGQPSAPSNSIKPSYARVTLEYLDSGTLVSPHKLEYLDSGNPLSPVPTQIADKPVSLPQPSCDLDSFNWTLPGTNLK
jgi:hypothetical protein